jgi:cellulose biosynthesis protein BcsQ
MKERDMIVNKKDPFFMKILPITEIEKSKLIGVMNHKGGVGKSSITDALAHWLVKQGFHVLVWDNDPQCNISQRLRIISDNEYIDRRVDEFYKELPRPYFRSKDLPIGLVYPRTIKKAGKLALMAGSPESEIYAGTAKNALGLQECINRFKDRMDYYRNYFDFIIVDTAPAIHNNALNELTINVADHLVIPMDGCEAILGLNQFMHWAQKIILGKKPGATLVMSKYHPDTCDILRITREAESFFDESKFTEENRNCMYRALKLVLGDYVCDHGIQERRVYRSHNYTGLKGQPKKAYDLLSEELLGKIDENRDAISYWIKQDIKKKLEEMIVPIENGRNRGVDCTFTNVHFASVGEKA